MNLQDRAELVATQLVAAVTEDLQSPSERQQRLIALMMLYWEWRTADAAIAQAVIDEAAALAPPGE